MSETLSQLIRNTKEYSNVCNMCKDEILIYPIISGRTEYTQDEVEQITLKRIIDKLQAKEQECENLNKRASSLGEIADDLQQRNHHLTQECERLNNEIIDMNSVIEDAAINLGNKDFTLYDLPFEIKKLSQECKNLKAEEKYLKQCCQKAGEELAKHSFEYDGKEKNLVVQAIELNEKYEKLKKALEEIEKVCLEHTQTFTDGATVHYYSLDEGFTIRKGNHWYNAKDGNDDR